MEMVIPWYSAIIGLALAIVLILMKLNPTYALIFGAVVGCLVGGADLVQTLNVLISGTQSVMGTVIRILSAGVFAGVMMESGAAETIANFIVRKMPGTFSLFALALATMVITGVGVFIPVAVLIVAPIALSVAAENGYSKIAILIALSGGGKAGNIISPNPNTIAAAEGFGISTIQAMVGGLIPALFGLLVTVLVANAIKSKYTKVTMHEKESQADDTKQASLPSVGKAFIAPVLAVVLLLLGPLGQAVGVTGLDFDSFYVLPIAGLIGLLIMGKSNKILDFTKSGLDRMTPTILIIIGAGAIGGLITASDLSTQIVTIMDTWNVPSVLLAPISGILMGAATASTSTGVILATGSFGPAILQTGIAPLNAAIMVHTGAVVIDHLPHGTYFHVSADAVDMSFADRMKCIGYESIIGLSIATSATIIYGIL